jgi:hypothetical protein
MKTLDNVKAKIQEREDHNQEGEELREEKERKS